MYSPGTDNSLNAHSIRLFPKGAGSRAYRITGIASRCDYVVLSDGRKPHIYLHRNVKTKYPRHIFLSMRSPYKALKYFTDQILPTIKAKFVLISGSEDITLPNQVDQRFKRFSDLELHCIHRILKNPYVSHWFCENLDDSSHPLMTPIPTGMVFKENHPSACIPIPDSLPLRKRPMRILCAHRVRKGPQWEPRRRVTQLALSEWSQWCTVLTEQIPENQFLELVRQHAFVLCVEGGGLDPSPKAWQTILNGSIPIVRDTALKQAYEEFPIAFVPSWDSSSISENILREWYEHFSNIYEDETFKSSVLVKLGLDYWWSKILMHEDKSIERPINILLVVSHWLDNITYPLYFAKERIEARLKSRASRLKNKYSKCLTRLLQGNDLRNKR